VAAAGRAEPGVDLPLGVPGVEKIKGPDPRIGDQAAPGGAGDGGNARADGRRRFDADGFDAGTDGAERKARFPTAIEHRFGLGVRVVAPAPGALRRHTAVPAVSAAASAPNAWRRL
jgi:hypothetical protein